MNIGSKIRTIYIRPLLHWIFVQLSKIKRQRGIFLCTLGHVHVVLKYGRCTYFLGKKKLTL